MPPPGLWSGQPTADDGVVFRLAQALASKSVLYRYILSDGRQQMSGTQAVTGSAASVRPSGGVASCGADISGGQVPALNEGGNRNVRHTRPLIVAPDMVSCQSCSVVHPCRGQG